MGYNIKDALIEGKGFARYKPWSDGVYIYCDSWGDISQQHLHGIKKDWSGDYEQLTSMEWLPVYAIETQGPNLLKKGSKRYLLFCDNKQIGKIG